MSAKFAKYVSMVPIVICLCHASDCSQQYAICPADIWAQAVHGCIAEYSHETGALFVYRQPPPSTHRIKLRVVGVAAGQAVWWDGRFKLQVHAIETGIVSEVHLKGKQSIMKCS